MPTRSTHSVALAGNLLSRTSKIRNNRLEALIVELAGIHGHSLLPGEAAHRAIPALLSFFIQTDSDPAVRVPSVPVENVCPRLPGPAMVARLGSALSAASNTPGVRDVIDEIAVDPVSFTDDRIRIETARAVLTGISLLCARVASRESSRLPMNSRWKAKASRANSMWRVKP